MDIYIDTHRSQIDARFLRFSEILRCSQASFMSKHGALTVYPRILLVDFDHFGWQGNLKTNQRIFRFGNSPRSLKRLDPRRFERRQLNPLVCWWGGKGRLEAPAVCIYQMIQMYISHSESLFCLGGDFASTAEIVTAEIVLFWWVFLTRWLQGRWY